MRHEELGQLSWALGRLQRRPQPQWLQALLDATLPQLDSMPLLSTASLLCALRRLEYVPPAAWMVAAVRAAQRGVMEAQAVSWVVVVRVLWACRDGMQVQLAACVAWT